MIALSRKAPARCTTAAAADGRRQTARKLSLRRMPESRGRREERVRRASAGHELPDSLTGLGVHQETSKEYVAASNSNAEFSRRSADASNVYAEFSMVYLAASREGVDESNVCVAATIVCVAASNVCVAASMELADASIVFVIPSGARNLGSLVVEHSFHGLSELCDCPP